MVLAFESALPQASNLPSSFLCVHEAAARAMAASRDRRLRPVQFELLGVRAEPGSGRPELPCMRGPPMYRSAYFGRRSKNSSLRTPGLARRAAQPVRHQRQRALHQQGRQRPRHPPQPRPRAGPAEPRACEGVHPARTAPAAFWLGLSVHVTTPSRAS